MRFPGFIHKNGGRVKVNPSFGWFFITQLSKTNAQNLKQLYSKQFHPSNFVGSNTYLSYLDKDVYKTMSKESDIRLTHKSNFFEISASFQSGKQYMVEATENWDGIDTNYCSKYYERSYLCKNLTSSVFEKFSNDLQVYDIEEVPVGHTSNRFAAGFAQSGHDFLEYDNDLLRVKRSLNERGLTGKGIVATVLDTGLDTNSVFFKDPDHEIGPSHRKVIEYKQDVHPGTDDNVHGTHVCGILCGKSYVPNSVASLYDGIAPEAKLHFVDVGNENNIQMHPDISKFEQKMIEYGTSVQSNSWGFTEEKSFFEMYDKLTYNNPQIVFLGASGNFGRSQLNNPCTSKNFLGVGSMTKIGVAYSTGSYKAEIRGGDITVEVEDPFLFLNQTGETLIKFNDLDVSTAPQAGKVYVSESCVSSGDFAMLICKGEKPQSKPAFPIFLCNNAEDFTKISGMSKISFYIKPVFKEEPEWSPSLFTSWGPSKHNVVKPEIVAYGSEIISAAAGSTKADISSVSVLDGTSMATPNAAGLAVLVNNYFKDGFYPTLQSNAENTLNPSSALVKATIINSCVMFNNTIFDKKAGFGYPILSRSLGFDGFGVRFLNDKKIESAGHTIYKFVTKRPSDFSVTMVYNDYPVLFDYQGPLYFNADLVVEDPQGNTYTANAPAEYNDEEQFSPCERVYIKNAPAGEYKVHIYSAKYDEAVSLLYSLAVLGGFDTKDLETNPLETPTLPVKAKCPKSCSNNGVCVNGACKCNGNYYGHYCQNQMIDLEPNVEHDFIITHRRTTWVHIRVPKGSELSISLKGMKCIDPDDFLCHPRVEKRVIVTNDKLFSEPDYKSFFEQGEEFTTESFVYDTESRNLYLGFYVVSYHDFSSKLTINVIESTTDDMTGPDGPEYVPDVPDVKPSASSEEESKEDKPEIVESETVESSEEENPEIVESSEEENPEIVESSEEESKPEENESTKPNEDGSEGEDLNSSPLSAGAISGIVIGCVVIVGVVSFCVYWFGFKKHRKVAAENIKKAEESNNSCELDDKAL